MVETRTVDGTTACTIVAPTPTSADAKCDLDCLSGGTCVLGNNHQPLCRCPLGFGGKRCEHFLCSQFCKNKGLCILVTSQEIRTKRQNSSSCRCPPQWTGQRCETSLNVCELCMRDGSCANGFADVRCKHCILRRPGNDLGRCTQEDPCRSQGGDEYCVHGVCRTNSAGARHCICAAGYIGDRCDTLSPMCESYCRNGGECFRHASSRAAPPRRPWFGVPSRKHRFGGFRRLSKCPPSVGLDRVASSNLKGQCLKMKEGTCVERISDVDRASKCRLYVYCEVSLTLLIFPVQPVKKDKRKEKGEKLVVLLSKYCSERNCTYSVSAEPKWYCCTSQMRA
ncbi:unnamed protein product [Ixodes pacificus]